MKCLICKMSMSIILMSATSWSNEFSFFSRFGIDLTVVSSFWSLSVSHLSYSLKSLKVFLIVTCILL